LLKLSPIVQHFHQEADQPLLLLLLFKQSLEQLYDKHKYSLATYILAQALDDLTISF
jgi:hypothetical protein